MAVRPVLRMGDARLLRRAEPLRDFDPARMQALLADMRDTLRAEGGVGLAAPQIGVNLRVVLIEVAADNERYPGMDAIPETVLVNPVLELLDAPREEGWEGCLSVPGLRGKVARASRVRYQAQDQHGALVDHTVSGFHARIVQHECDHLDGILYPMRLTDWRDFGFKEALFPAA